MIHYSPALEARWLRLCRKLQRDAADPAAGMHAAPADAQASSTADTGHTPEGLFRKLCLAYSLAPRKYHTLAHVEQCLALLDSYRHLAIEPDAIEYALWLHDVFYDPRRDDNEEVSCAASAMFGGKMRLSADFLAACAKLIIATKHGAVGASGMLDGDATLMVDIDLAILGSPPDEYRRYTRAIRWEYGFATDEQFRAGRGKFLTMMLEREEIFRTPDLRERFEVAARANIDAELERLTGG